MVKQFVELPPEAIEEAIKGHEDILTPAFDAEKERITSMCCPECGENAVMKVNPERPFIEGRPLPVYIPFCPKCDRFITTLE